MYGAYPGKAPRRILLYLSAAEWERNYQAGEETFELYKTARDFEADVIIMRLIENCPAKDYEKELFIKQYGDFIDYLNKSGKARILITTGFWEHPAKEAIIAYAAQNHLPCIPLEDLGELDEMKAIGRFAHDGVANHPGDLGMQHIAKRILSVFDEI